MRCVCVGGGGGLLEQLLYERILISDCQMLVGLYVYVLISFVYVLYKLLAISNHL